MESPNSSIQETTFGGVTLRWRWCTSEGKHWVEILKIFTPPELRHHGLGTEAVKHFLRMLPAHTEVHLFPEPFEKVNQALQDVFMSAESEDLWDQVAFWRRHLEGWYRRLGFQPSAETENEWVKET